MDADIAKLRNNLTLWALGKFPARLEEVQQWIIELDTLLQQKEL